jgi:uncharacterized protein
MSQSPRILSVAALVLLVACASPREHLYSLEDASSDVPIGTNDRATVVIERVSVPEVVDRPQLVVREGTYHIRINEQERWATPLKESLPRLLATQLTQRMTDRRFVPMASAAINTPSARLFIDVSSMELARATGVRVVAHWIYRPVSRDMVPIEGETTAHTEVTMDGYPGFVDALRRAGIAIAEDIAARLNAK